MLVMKPFMRLWLTYTLLLDRLPGADLVQDLSRWRISCVTSRDANVEAETHAGSRGKHANRGADLRGYLSAALQQDVVDTGFLIFVAIRVSSLYPRESL